MHHHIILSEDHANLIKPLNELEIIPAIKSFKSFKAPDGFEPFFFQKYLSNILPALSALYHNYFQNKIIPPFLNQTYLTHSKINLP